MLHRLQRAPLPAAFIATVAVLVLRCLVIGVAASAPPSEARITTASVQETQASGSRADTLSYLAANPAVSNAAIATLDSETLGYFWDYQTELAENGAIQMQRPANTPTDSATTGPTRVYLSSAEAARIHAAKTAHAIWVDQHRRVPWRLSDYDPEHLRGLFDKATVLSRHSATTFSFYSVVDYSPTDAWHYAIEHDLIRETAFATIQAVLDDFRSDTLHGSASLGDPSCAYTMRYALTNYSASRFRPARIARSGCHSMSRILLGVLRSMNIPGYETTTGEYFLNLHSEAVLPCVERVLPHGDHVYSADLTCTPSDQLMPTFQFFQDNLFTPPCDGVPYRVALRHEALKGTLYPTPTILRGARNPAFYGYTNAVEFLSRYAGWNQGLTEAELQQAADTLLTQFDETRRLTVPTDTPRGWVLNTPGSVDYVVDSRVSLKALAKPGYRFSHWTGDVAQGMETANPLVLTLAGDTTIQAVFTRPPVTLSITRTREGDSQLSFTAEAEAIYTLEYRPDLSSGTWNTLVEIQPRPTPGTVTITDPEPQTQRFYRVVAPQ